ncbi:MAG: SH3 domain-containing protein [Candidatus Cloacimonetes bacterium]|nr:SH3 domain-containing protein [Candidatus Cloacimonadota bacterium]
MKKTKNSFLFYTILIVFLLLSACFNNSISPVNQQITSPQGIVEDLLNYSQDPFFYAKLINQDSLLVSQNRQNELYIGFVSKFFAVWIDTLFISDLSNGTGENILLSEKAENTLEYYQNQINNLFINAGIGENKLARDADFANEIKIIANLENGFNTMKKGIMLNYSHIRVMPSVKPFYLDFALAGEGYPFDYWQNSTIPIGTPIFIYHESENWALIESHICSGWVPRNMIAYLEEEMINQVMLAEQIAITSDRTPLYNKNGSYVAHADIGTVFSVINDLGYAYEVFHFNRDEFNNGVLASLRVSKNDFDTVTQSAPRIIPIPLTAGNLANISSKMMGQVYGWGGMYFNRDCSQSLLDLYIGFGILLPRNGRAQAYEYGRFHDMSHIENNFEKKKEIIDLATPFTTLIRTPGHIMLYLGHVAEEPIVFHTIWGIRTIESDGKDGRHIIGKTAITTLEPGKELPNVHSTLINRLEGITFICE